MNNFCIATTTVPLQVYPVQGREDENTENTHRETGENKKMVDMEVENDHMNKNMQHYDVCYLLFESPDLHSTIYNRRRTSQDLIELQPPNKVTWVVGPSQRVEVQRRLHIIGAHVTKCRDVAGQTHAARYTVRHRGHLSDNDTAIWHGTTWHLHTHNR